MLNRPAGSPHSLRSLQDNKPYATEHWSYTPSSPVATRLGGVSLESLLSSLTERIVLMDIYIIYYKQKVMLIADAGCRC